jgi:hypothetical protein
MLIKKILLFMQQLFLYQVLLMLKFISLFLNTHSTNKNIALKYRLTFVAVHKYIYY